MSYSVYMHTSPSGKRYIGITRQPVSNRWKNGNGYKNNPAFYSAILKYGWENIKHEIIDVVEAKEDAEKEEIYLISKYKSDDKNYGYNIDHGGNCTGTHSEETKRKIGWSNHIAKEGVPTHRKMSEYQKERMREGAIKKAKENGGYQKTMLGKHHTAEAKEKMSAIQKERWKDSSYREKQRASRKDFSGKNNPNYGKHLSKETKDKISESIKKSSHSEKNIERLKNLHNKMKKPVIKYDSEHNFIEKYDSVDSAAKSVSGNSQNVGRGCRTGAIVYGFLWEYANDNI